MPPKFTLPSSSVSVHALEVALLFQVLTFSHKVTFFKVQD